MLLGGLMPSVTKLELWKRTKQDKMQQKHKKEVLSVDGCHGSTTRWENCKTAQSDKHCFGTPKEHDDDEEDQRPTGEDHVNKN